MNENSHPVEMRMMVETEDKRITSLLEGYLAKYDALIFPNNTIMIQIIDGENGNSFLKIKDEHYQAPFRFSRLLHVNPFIRFCDRLRKKPTVYCYTLIVKGSSHYFKGIKQNTPLLIPPSHSKRPPLSEDACLAGIAAHEVRHRVQYEFPSQTFFTPFNISKHRSLHLQALQLLTTREIYDSTGTILNHREFDARIIESLIQFTTLAYGSDTLGIGNIITATPNTLDEVMRNITEKNKR